MENQETVFVKVLKPIWLFEDDFKVGKVYEALRYGNGFALRIAFTDAFDSYAYQEEVELINK